MSIINVSEGGIGITEYKIGDLISATSTTQLTTLSAVEYGYVLISQGINTMPTYGKIDLSLHIENILPVINGGLNLTTYITGDIIYANSSYSLNKLNDIAINNVLLSTNINEIPSYGKADLELYTDNTLQLTNGGIGISSYTKGDLIVGINSNQFGVLSSVAEGNILLGTGVGNLLSWGKINLGTSIISNTLPLTKGGTGINTSLTDGVIYIITTTFTRVALSSAKYFLLRNNNALSFQQSNRLVQYQTNNTSALITCGQMFADDTIPQWSEGTLIISISNYIAKAIGNTLIIYVNLSTGVNSSLNNAGILALFVGTGPDAIASTFTTSNGNGSSYNGSGCLIYNTTVSSLSATTYNVRFGSSNAPSTSFINSSASSASARYGGTLKSVIQIYEYSTL